jgi:hypothetical protein
MPALQPVTGPTWEQLEALAKTKEGDQASRLQQAAAELWRHIAEQTKPPGE